jgi:hypothetical protein
MQRDLTSYIKQASDASGGGGGTFANPQNAYAAFAPTDTMRGIANQGTGQIANQFTGPGGGLNPWMQDVQQSIQSNPAANLQTLQGMTPTAQGYSDQGGTRDAMSLVQGAQSMAPYTPQAQGYGGPGIQQGFQTGQNAFGYGGPGGGGQYANTPGAMAYDPTMALQAAQNNLQRVIAPELQNNAVAGGSNPMSGAYAEAITNAGAQMALPIQQQIMQNQANWYNPQLQGAIQGGLGQQGAANQLVSQGFGLQGQGALAQQGAQNQFLGTQQQGGVQGVLAQQAAQNQLLGQGFGAQLQGGLNQQNAQNQFLGAQQNAGLQGLLNQGQSQFQGAMAIPGMQGQFINNITQGTQGQMGLQGMDQQARANAFLNAQNQWNQAMSALSGTSFTNPGMSSYGTQGGGGGFSGGSALGGAASGALMGSMTGNPLGVAGGAVIGGVMGGFGGCWIADALYGEGSKNAQAARVWVGEGWQGEEADEFREWYLEHGKRVADALLENGDFTAQHWFRYKELFDSFVRKGREYLAVRHAA